MFETGKFRFVLADADIISKLAHWRLLHHLPAVFDCDIKSIATLDSLVYRAQKAISNPDKLFKDNVTAIYAHEFLSQLPKLASPNVDALQSLQRIPNIDSGEALLIAILEATQDSILATGDKRALKAIHSAMTNGLSCQIEGRIICLEQLLSCLLTLIGHADWLASISRAPTMDTAIRMVCGSGCNAPMEQIVNGLKSYTESIRNECGTILMLN